MGTLILFLLREWAQQILQKRKWAQGSKLLAQLTRAERGTGALDTLTGSWGGARPFGFHWLSLIK